MELYDLFKDILVPVYGVLLAGIITIIIKPAFYKEWVLRLKRPKPTVYFSTEEFRLELYRVSKYIESTKRVSNFFKFERFPGTFVWGKLQHDKYTFASISLTVQDSENASRNPLRLIKLFRLIATPFIWSKGTQACLNVLRIFILFQHRSQHYQDQSP